MTLEFLTKHRANNTFNYLIFYTKLIRYKFYVFLIRTNIFPVRYLHYRHTQKHRVRQTDDSRKAK